MIEVGTVVEFDHYFGTNKGEVVYICKGCVQIKPDKDFRGGNKFIYKDPSEVREVEEKDE